MNRFTPILDASEKLEAQPFHVAACALGEGPFWFHDQLWWVDIEGGSLHTIATDGAKLSHSFGQRIGSCAPINDQSFVVALQEGVGIWCRKTGAVKILASPEAGWSDSRFNEGKCDPKGRFLAGTLNMIGLKESSSLYTLDIDGSLRQLVGSITISNGLAWSRDGRTLYFIDTPTLEVAAFDYDLETGLLGAKRIAVEIPEKAGYPDGMTIDKDGNLWIAHWDGWAVRCWSPISGKCLAEVQLPCQRPTSCCFGGPQYDKLFITTARVGFTAAELEEQPLSGSIFVYHPQTSGFPIHTCQLSPPEPLLQFENSI